jgi:hypothetical protein
LIRDLKKDLSRLKDLMRDDIPAHITDILKPLKASVDQTQQLIVPGEGSSQPLRCDYLVKTCKKTQAQGRAL